MRVSRNGLTFRAGLLCLLVILAAGALASLPRGSAQERSYDRPPPPPYPREALELDPAPVSAGYLFLDGEYIPPPYEVRCTDEIVSVNGRALTCDLNEPFGGGSRGYGSPRPENPILTAAITLRTQLATPDWVVLSFTGQPKIVLDAGSAHSLFKLLTSNGEESRRKSLVERVRPGFDLDVWNKWLDQYEAPPELRKRTSGLIAAFDRAERRALAEIGANRRLNDWSYPLSIAGFIVTVLAVGHLLGGRPHAGQPTHGQDVAPQSIHSFHCSLAIIALISVLDLTWTILAAQAGQMRELNPIGSHLIADPRHLIGFKVGATFPSLALLWLLRRHKRAQIAAWWLCLVLVLLEFRWVTINSAFLAA